MSKHSYSRSGSKLDCVSVRRIDVNPKIVTVDGPLVLWAERMGHPITPELIAKALRQYLKTLERTRSYKAKRRATVEGRDHINRLNRESRARAKDDMCYIKEDRR